MSQSAIIERQFNKDFLAICISRKTPLTVRYPISAVIPGKHGFQKDAWHHVGFTGIGYSVMLIETMRMAAHPVMITVLKMAPSMVQKVSDLEGGKLID